MQNYKMVISYDGTRFNGWQKQKNSKNTIQDLFEVTLSKVIGEKAEVTASGRTDAGVHALGQVINFKTHTELEPVLLMDKVNGLLPTDIAVKNCELTDIRFHARYNAKMKLYEYRILNHKCHDPFIKRYSYHYSDVLDLKSMKSGAQLLIGTHDFNCFSSAKKTNKTTVRSIGSIDIKKVGREVVISYLGDGFLHNMVRVLTGTLIEIGSGKRTIDTIPTIFETGDRTQAGYTVPPNGLFLKEVIY